VRAKKTKTLPGVIRYVLSADRRLKRISLKRMALPAKRAKKEARKPARSARPTARAKVAPRSPWPIRRTATIAAAVGVIAAMALIPARRPSRQGDVVLAPEQPTAEPVPVESTSLGTVADAAPPIAPEVLVPSREQKTPPAAPVRTAPPVAAARPTVTRTPSPRSETAAKPTTVLASTDAEVAPVLPTEPPRRPTTTEPAPVPTESAASQTPAVTITGCLEQDDETFWLKDTSGDSAPKARSWRFAFLKKKQAPIALIDSANRLELRRHVGERIAATGVLADREMQARSLRLVSSSCK
jgi:hypothetical protein